MNLDGGKKVGFYLYTVSDGIRSSNLGMSYPCGQRNHPN